MRKLLAGLVLTTMLACAKPQDTSVKPDSTSQTETPKKRGGSGTGREFEALALSALVVLVLFPVLLSSDK